MPKTASKRAQARRATRVQRAHQIVQERPISRRVPAAPRRSQPHGVGAVVRDYPWATTIFVGLVVVLIVLIAHQQRLGPWAPPSPPAAASCNLATHVCNKAPAVTINAKKVYTATIKTSKGDIVVQLDPVSSPNAVNDFVFLADQHFYDGLKFTRVERIGQVSPLTQQPSNIAIVQGGAGGVKGGPGYTIPSDQAAGGHTAGTVALANASQFFIDTADNSQAMSGATYSVLGHITSGLDVAKALNVGDTIKSIRIQVSNPPTPTPVPTATHTPAPTATPKK
jgi:peptidylprolyl isomerase